MHRPGELGLRFRVLDVGVIAADNVFLGIKLPANLSAGVNIIPGIYAGHEMNMGG
jgi:hypothetical protein